MTESNKLTVRFVEQVKTAGVYRDGGGLLLRVEPSGSKRWILRTTVCGRRRDLGLGSAGSVSLAEARDEAFELRRAARRGLDPVVSRKKRLQKATTFADAAEALHARRVKDKAWRSGKHQDQWINTLRAYAFPIIGKMAVGEVQAADVLRLLTPIWLQKPETARRVRQRIHVVLDWAVAAGHRSHHSVNAAEAVRSGLPKQHRDRRHHPALPWQEIPAFVTQIRSSANSEAVRFALQFLLLTASRTSETLGARWDEVLDDGTWVVPASRMKANRPHRVPLAKPVLQILRECRARWPDSKLLFPSRDGVQPLSNMALLMLMRRLGRREVPHGLRSSFRDWAADNRQDRQLAEAALAHSLSNATEAAYFRTDLLEARRLLMTDWAHYACGSAGGRHGQ